MKAAPVIVRALRGEPLKRVAVSVGDRVIYVAAPAQMDAIQAGRSEPVGFPKEDVFVFDEDVFSMLSAAWHLAKVESSATWSRLKRFQP